MQAIKVLRRCTGEGGRGFLPAYSAAGPAASAFSPFIVSMPLSIFPEFAPQFGASFLRMPPLTVLLRCAGHSAAGWLP